MSRARGWRSDDADCLLSLVSEYKLTIREQPKHSRMCGVGEKGECDECSPTHRGVVSLY